ncbi:SDR family NAD(P)-dependent oxidoreductase [Neorhizobium galegae]|uniref:Short-chain dehydrogenase/reductase SDR n=1 Tax=Neorhizobium galegae bv. orientalis str. HAMBI 540 TaxID=1028800 RepID=A0A068T3C7_NEOGA|nr:Hypothetical protein RG540_PA12340 [Neorhizobium galegae bv. orientalis str. HAMBI 540]
MKIELWYGLRAWKVAFVTGSSKGVGEGVARGLAREGATVIAHGRDKTKTEVVAHDIIVQGGRAFAVLGELRRRARALWPIVIPDLRAVTMARTSTAKSRHDITVLLHPSEEQRPDVIPCISWIKIDVPRLLKFEGNSDLHPKIPTEELRWNRHHWSHPLSSLSEGESEDVAA